MDCHTVDEGADRVRHRVRFELETSIADPDHAVAGDHEFGVHAPIVLERPARAVVLATVGLDD
jgi:hypothetical protein